MIIVELHDLLTCIIIIHEYRNHNNNKYSWDYKLVVLIVRSFVINLLMLIGNRVWLDRQCPRSTKKVKPH